MKHCLFTFCLILFLSCERQEPLWIFSGRTMGTTYQVKIADPPHAGHQTDILQQEVDQALAGINRQMSVYDPVSEISRFNALRSTEPFPVSREFVNVLRTAMQVSHESGGSFDVTIAPLVNLWGFGKRDLRGLIPDNMQIDSCRNIVGFQHIHILDDSTIRKDIPSLELDFGGIAQGYGVDVITEIVSGKGYQNFLVELGGELVLRGLNHGRKWQIGIDRPGLGALPGQNLEAVLELSDIAVSTSGDYRNFFVNNDTVYSHTISPATGRPVNNGLASVTIIAPNCTLADAMCTAVMVMGAGEGLRWIESRPDMDAFFILRENGKYIEKMTTGFEKYLK